MTIDMKRMLRFRKDAGKGAAWWWSDPPLRYGVHEDERDVTHWFTTQADRSAYVAYLQSCNVSYQLVERTRLFSPA
jgi:hypothetical protein